MFKSRIKRNAIAFSFFAAVLTVCQSASAQLNIGRYGIQPGLEPIYLQYQLLGQDLSKMEGISVCTVGFGLGCNKTGTLMQQLLESNNRPSYYDLLMQAAGGEENFRNFASFYGNNPNLLYVPYASFWQNDTPDILDGYPYLLGGAVSRTPVEGLGLVTKNFYWAPLQGVGNSLDLRSGLLNLKYSYGRLLFEELAKIPNAQQQIQRLNLPSNIRQFYLSHLSSGLRALNTGDETLLKQSVLDTLSLPFSPNSGEFNRSNIGIPQEFNQLIGLDLPGEVFVTAFPVLPTLEVVSQRIPSISVGDTFVQEDSNNGFPGWLLGGASLAALLVILSLSGGSSSHSRPNNAIAVTPAVGSGSNPIEYGPTPVGGRVPSEHNQIIEVPPAPSVTPVPGEQFKKVPEPSVIKPLILLILLLCILNRKKGVRT
ncbi:hypothetical protein F7734_14525 [Scytonema sp. UIC 10036]|uniref:hypothetical protein n=1 Tax=Scytonema sp. UIC 10036 TaxID=2304196 RepID=UPI0012DA3593|nr:hypothetical protein [Scytonema sp. UIC 10036]MUG93573.1 hypothetical protein [Scytonema sp. UIC 10036]